MSSLGLPMAQDFVENLVSMPALRIVDALASGRLPKLTASTQGIISIACIYNPSTSLSSCNTRLAK